MTQSTNTKAPERISVDFNGNKTASVISDVPEILGTLEYQRADLAPQWQDIATAPKDGKRFLAYEKRDGYGLYECWYQHDFSNWCGWQDDSDSEPEPTHWMPLPNPPEPK